MAQIIRKHNKSIINPKRTAERNVIAPSAEIALPAVSFTNPSLRPQTMKKSSTWNCLRAHGNKETTNTNTHSTTESKKTALPYQSSSGQLKTETTMRHPRYHGQS